MTHHVGLNCATLLTIVVLGVVPAVRADITYSNDFESDTSGFDTADRASLPTDAQGLGSTNQSQFLGLFTNNTATLNLSGLTTGITYSVAFDLFIGSSWDGNDTRFGPDNWRLTADGTSLVDTTFLNILLGEADLIDFTQSYSDSNPVGLGSYGPFTGADVARSNL